ncbi:MAG: type II toxin-antitoxin system prevent-host-death family antitoxin [Actinobacteria bacterium]|jgi:prevent-host-death family protein|nr:type II toxin-antitoxin system prevent-host-death family antitoxin [Actinomycetota bacterium]
MRTIPQRELRNNSAAVLRDAEDGEEFIITVDGRPVAVLGPYRKRQWVPADAVSRLLATPTDPSLLDDVRAETRDEISDPWAS